MSLNQAVIFYNFFLYFSLQCHPIKFEFKKLKSHHYVIQQTKNDTIIKA